MSDWRIDLLRRLRMPLTASNLQFLQAWGKAEGGGGYAGRPTTAYNWLNTTWQMPGSTRYNSVGVQNYASYDQGVAATAKTLNQDYYDRIRQLLAQGNAPLPSLAQAVYSSPWGTKHGIAGVDPSMGVPSGASGAPAAAAPSAAARAPFSPPTPSPLLGIAGLGDPRVQSQGLLQMLLQPQPRPQVQPPPASPATPTPASGSPGNVRFQKQGGGPPGIRELFYDPKGAYDEGNWISPIGGHSDHIHASFGDPRTALAVMAMAQRMGLRVGENPYYDRVDPVHTEGSYHYRLFPGRYNGRQLGRAADISGSAALMARLWDAILKGGYLG